MSVVANPTALPVRARENTSDESSRNPAEIWRDEVDRRLDQHLSDCCNDCGGNSDLNSDLNSDRNSDRNSGQACPRLLLAMRYGVLSPGKRVRPLLAVLTALDFNRDPRDLLDFACALEMVHCASLILDDLPCMDNAGLRRGRKTLHREFDQATATLAAVGLLNQAFGIVADCEALEMSFRNELIKRLSEAVGTSGLVSGQSRDLNDRRSPLSHTALERINHQKTAILFELAVVAGGRHAGVEGARLEALNRFAGHVGLAFQAADDLLDSRAHSARAGVSSGKRADSDRGKAGSVHQLGESALIQQIQSQLAAAESELQAMQVSGRYLCGYVRGLFQRYC